MSLQFSPNQAPVVVVSDFLSDAPLSLHKAAPLLSEHPVIQFELDTFVLRHLILCFFLLCHHNQGLNTKDTN